MIIERNDIRIAVQQFPDRKNPSLVIERGNTGYVVGFFSSKEKAKDFEDAVKELLAGMIVEDK